jgi:hemerythrin-like domain-containing protein
MRYFDQAAPHHHRDEELHVFPPLLAQGEPHVVAVVTRLQQDHVLMERRWQEARCVLGRLQEGRLQALGAAEDAVLDAFAGLYDGHIRAEEEIAYPAVQTALDAPTLQAMGEEMMRRRGVK